MGAAGASAGSVLGWVVIENLISCSIHSRRDRMVYFRKIAIYFLFIEYYGDTSALDCNFLDEDGGC